MTNKEWKLLNPGKVKAANHAWHLANKAYVIKRQKTYNLKNKEKVELANKTYYKNNYSKILAKKQAKRKLNWPLFGAIGTIQSHRRRGNKMLITVEWLEKLAHKTEECPICKVKLAWNEKINNSQLTNSPSLDRLNNGNTLSKNNVWIICTVCNITKGARTMKQFIRYCNLISKNYGK